MKRYVFEYANDLKRHPYCDAEREGLIDKWLKCYKMGIAGELDVMVCLNSEHKRLHSIELNERKKENLK